MLIDALAFSLGNLVILLAAMTALWLFSARIKDASIIDIAWGPACALPAILTFVRLQPDTARASLLTLLVVIWAARLAWHIGKRHHHGGEEDIRYQHMRAAQGSDEAFAKWSLPRVFWLQGVIAWIVSLPVQLGQFGGGAIGVLTFIGCAIFLTGLAFEAIGDWQLSRFKSDPANKGKLMRSGLWAWTRHPNYFGDSLVWFGLTIIALEGPLGVYTILSPIIMAFFLVFISGKALTEKLMFAKYPEYAAYQAQTSGFIPKPPNKKT